MFSSLKNDAYRFLRFKLIYVLALGFMAFMLYISFDNLPVGGINGYECNAVEVADGSIEYSYSFSTVWSGVRHGYMEDLEDINSINDSLEDAIYCCSDLIPVFSAVLTIISVFIFEFMTNKKGTIGNRIATGTSKFKFLTNKFLFAFLVNIGFVLIGTIALAIAMIFLKCIPIVGNFVLGEFLLSIVIYAILIPSLIVLVLGINYNLGPVVAILLAFTVLLISYEVDSNIQMSLREFRYYGIETIEEENMAGSDKELNPMFIGGKKRKLYVAIREMCLTTSLNSNRHAYITKTDARNNFPADRFDYFQTADKQIISAIFWIVVSNSVSLFLYRKMERI